MLAYLKRICFLLIQTFMVLPAVAEPPGTYYLHFEVGQISHSSTVGAETVSNSFTFEAWLRLDENPAVAQSIVCGQQAYALDYAPAGEVSGRFWFHTPSNELDPGGWSIVLRTDQGIVGTPPVDSIPVGAWTHVAGTWDGAVVRFLVDGNEVASVAHSGSTMLFADNQLGESCQWDPQLLMSVGGGYGGRGGKGFKGALRDLALWDHALDSGDLAARSSANISGNEPGLLHLWSFDSGKKPGIK